MRPFVLKSPLLCAYVIALAAFNAGTASAAYPDRPIRYIVPSAAGGGADALARILAGELTKQLGQQVVVDNRAGASGAIGMDMLVRANPDGYTIGYGNTPLLAINKSLLPNWQYEAGRDVQPVARLTNSQNLLAVTPSLPVKSVRELIDYAKSNPDKLSYASPGNGTTIHLSAELFKQMAGVRMPWTNSPVIVGAEPASPQPTAPSASIRTSTLSALVSTPLERLIDWVSGRLTAIDSTR